MSLFGTIMGAAAGPLGSIASNLIQNAGAKNRQEQANKDNIRFWQMQNEYNHPTAQMERLRSAGLNPNMIYGTQPSSAVGSAGSIAPSKAPEYKMDNPVASLNAFNQFRNTEAQTDNLRASNTVMVQEAALKAAQNAESSARTARSKFDLELAQELKQTSLQAAQANLNRINEQVVGYKIDNEVKDATKANQIKKVAMDINVAAARIKNMKASTKNLEAEKALKDYERTLGFYGISKNGSLVSELLRPLIMLLDTFDPVVKD